MTNYNELNHKYLKALDRLSDQDITIDSLTLEVERLTNIKALAQAVVDDTDHITRGFKISELRAALRDETNKDNECLHENSFIPEDSGPIKWGDSKFCEDCHSIVLADGSIFMKIPPVPEKETNNGGDRV